ncbi:MAG: SLC13 family permease [Gammaproteobacteria bacterium]|nr:SLC13 family permease [Gammaproteobacteria bacterium]
MNAEYVYLAVTLAGAMCLFWSQRLSTDLTGLLVMLAMIVPWPHPDGSWSAVLEPAEGFSGFGSAAVIMIASMFVLGASIVQTGAAETLGLKLLRAVAHSEWRLQLAVLVLATLISTFVNDTTVVLILLPLIVSLCKEKQLSPSRYLMFAAYGSLLGGMWTLIGTRSNIIMSDYLRQETGSGIGFFEFTPIAAVVFLFCGLFFMLVGRRLLPGQMPVLSGDVMKEFLTEVDVPEGSAAVGQRLTDLDSFARDKLTVVALLRDERRVPRTAQLREGDVLIVRGSAERIGELVKSADFKVREESKLDEKALQSVDLVTVEAVLPVHSRYAGYTLNHMPFSRNYGMTVLGVARQGKAVAERIMETRLEGGDSLLFLGSAEDVERLRENTGLLVLQEESFPAIGKRKAWTTGLLLVAVVLLAVTGLLSPAISIPLAAVCAVLLGCISWRGAYEAVDWPTLVLLGGMISFGVALEKTGGAEALALVTVNAFSGVDPIYLFAALLLIALVLTQLIENAAVAIVMAPVAFEVAQATGMEPKPMLIAIAICVSAGFSTPVAHESTILVMGPGQYRFKHYLMIGSVLAVITWVVATVWTPVLWDLL